MFFVSQQGEATTTTAAPSQITTTSAVKVSTPAPSISAATSPVRPRTSGIQRHISRTSYKAESEDSADDRPLATSVPQSSTTTQKRALQRSTTPQTTNQAHKRHKTAPSDIDIEPTVVLIAQPQQQQQQQPQLVQVHVPASVSVADDKSIGEPEFIDMPIELPTKSEPEYADDGQDEEAMDQTTEHDPDQDDQEEHDEEEGEHEEATYVEDESYGDMKYDESYFTENDETKAGASGFSESYAEAGGEAAGTEAQG